MIIRSDLLALTFYEREAFTGSDGNMNFHIKRVKNDESDNFVATVWPGPYAMPQTDPAKYITHEEPYTEEGLLAVTEWMNEQSPEFQKHIDSILDVEPYIPSTEEES